MAYEYNPQSARFDVPNPHRVENLFLAACAATTFIAAIALLFDARDLFLARDIARFLKAVLSAASLLAFAVGYAFLLMGQLRFFFGRGQPADLVPSLHADQTGYHADPHAERQIPDAVALRQTLQQNAIAYRVPHGPIDNLLYALVRKLVYSPRLTRERVQEQFRNLLGIAMLLILFPVSLAGISNAAALFWIGAFYFGLTNVLVLRPFAKAGRRPPAVREQAALLFIIVAIVAPVILAKVVPPHGYPLRGVIDFIPVTFAALGAALVVSGSMFAAGIANTVEPTQIAIAPHLETPSVNTSPAQIWTELARELQRLWQEQVPNRTYMRIVPDVSERQGAFSAHVIEETQPLPVDAQRMTFARAAALPTTRPLLVADVLCTLFTIAGAAVVVWGATAPAAYTAIAIGGALVVVGGSGIRAANGLWRRFTFTSHIYWVEWNGNYTRAATKLGATFTDRVQSEREIVSVESMTLRVWAAEIDSVAFNTDRDRDLVAIRGRPDEAARLGRWLAAFAADVGSVTVPFAPVDRARIDALNVLNAKAPPDPPPPALSDRPTEAIPIAGPARDPSTGDGRRFCTQCGTPVATGAAFCGTCGHRLG